MNDKGQQENIFWRYSADRRQMPLPMTGAEEDGYYALEINSREGKQEWLRLHLDNGMIHLIPYIDLRHAIYTQDWLVLECETYMVTLIGGNLLPALALLQSRELSAIYCHMDDETLPSNENAPFVIRLTVQTYEEAFVESEAAPKNEPPPAALRN